MNQTEREQQGFLAALRANEDDLATRAVYSDWLDEHGEFDEANRQRQWPAAKAWLVEFASQHSSENHYGYSGIYYEDLVDAGHDWIKSGGDDYFTQHGSQSLCDEGYETIQEFWRNWSIVTGVALPDGTYTSNPFNCSC